MPDLVSLGLVGPRRAAVPEGARLTGVMAETAEATSAWATEAGAMPAASVADLARACKVVAVGSGPGVRAHDVREALEQGAHVFAAWPPAASVTEAEALAARAEEAGAEVAVERPLPIDALVAARPAGWAARLVALDLAGADPAEGLDLPWSRRLAGALDAVMALVRSDAVARMDTEADRDGARLRSVLVSLRFRTGAYAHVGIREETEGWPPSVRLSASGGAVRLSARSLRGPICLEGTAPVREPDSTGLAAFVAAVRSGRVPTSGPGALSLADAVALMRLTERTMAALRMEPGARR
ncbi:MAG: Gfo/Idh/MocA family oxidoreductase [Bacteroidota bacterium]